MNTGAIYGADAGTQVQQTEEKTRVTGKTVGDPQLSKDAAKYYEQLKKKYSNMDFILVSSDKKEEAEANAARYASANRMVVLIDADKIEQMAANEEYRKKYENIISGAATQLMQVKDSLGANASNVKTYGMKIDDGGNASFFAVIDKSLAAQRERIQENREKKAEEQKKADKKEREERLERQRGKGKPDRTEKEDLVTVTAASAEELLKKINDAIYEAMSDNTMTDWEKKIGQNVDFAI